ncbi:acyl-CoA dehydrogenase family protein [Cupriavidus sp. AU9028]|uniref:acyl-CoA dehydrogenase family protein n=1 Tax=Cupriavidus sp. AU9028 TaxID=2871157 RepID=UPI001C9862B8|nr:acyl-CoA dehydrogenase family protein [Cupriavidus sp. AU9028]MBY4896931.1 acyl-CoA dehydrogenase family protein [Cupriavidus sp. AU9028]
MSARTTLWAAVAAPAVPEIAAAQPAPGRSANDADHPVPDQHGVNLFDADPDLRALLPLYLPEDLCRHLLPHLRRMGELAGGVLDTLANTADHHPPTLSVRTRTGIDAQRIDKHPAYVEMERVAFSEFGLAALSHRGGALGWPAPMPPAAKYALTYLFVQAEFGLCCPLSMTDSLTRTLRKFGAPELVARYLPSLTTEVFEDLYQGAMFMTEQGAGSDVAATATRALHVPAAVDGEADWRLSGDKWFCSNPDAELAMVLARPEGAPDGIKGVSLFLLPRRLPDGSPNHYRIIRLKDKLGTRSMASGEIRLEGAHAWLVGDPGRGFVQMADMINNSRLSNGMRAAGLMRRALSEGLFIARERRAFGRRLIDMPLMRRQLLKLTLPTEQARTMMFQTAEALRRADAGEADAYALMRILTPLIKFRACRDARKVTGDAMEMRGGCGYIEEWSDPRLVRDAHLGSIWEGTSNIVALDVLRAVRREGALPVLRAHLLALLEDTSLHAQAQAVFLHTLERACALADAAASARDAGDVLARQAASALYHVTSAVAMAWEAGRIGSVRRMRLAQLVLIHRVLPGDPLAGTTEPDWLVQTVSPDAGAAPHPQAEAVRQVNLF